MMSGGTDKEIAKLVNGCLDGNQADWQELINRLTPLIFSMCRKVRLSREESFDVFGRVSLLLLENLGNLRDAEKIFGYVSTMTFREALLLKDRTRIFASEIDEESLRRLHDEKAPLPVLDLERGEDLEVMARAFARLPRQCRELLRLLFLESDDISYQEISERTGTPVSSIGPTRMRCLEKLRSFMVKEGFEK